MPRAEMIQFRRGSLDQWNLVNPILADGEVGFANDANLIRIGDGVTAWLDLPSPASPEAEAALAEIETGRLSEAQLSATIAGVVAPGQLQVARAGKRYLLYGGVLRNNGSPNYWQPIEDASHSSVGIESVTTSGATISITHPNLGAAKMLSYACICDEQLTAAGFSVGASVGTNTDVLTLARSRPTIQGSARYNGSAWVWVGTSGVTLSYTAGILKITHPTIEGNLSSTYGIAVSAGGVSNAHPVLVNTTPLVTELQIQWLDRTTGTLLTTPSTDMRAFVQHGGGGTASVNPQSVDTTAYPSSNIWVMGLYEVDEDWQPPA